MLTVAERISRLPAPVCIPLGLLWLPCALTLLGLGMGAVGLAELCYRLQEKGGRAMRRLPKRKGKRADAMAKARVPKETWRLVGIAACLLLLALIAVFGRPFFKGCVLSLAEALHNITSWPYN